MPARWVAGSPIPAAQAQPVDSKCRSGLAASGIAYEHTNATGVCMFWMTACSGEGSHAHSSAAACNPGAAVLAETLK